ncbi:MAG: ABC transporter substrate-binding protein, partial [Firmicutes bacterium]|nr:ABC transporter substrate-binding protein [Bacillota bacterium]
PKGTLVSEVLDFVGGYNVADIPFKGGGGLSPVTLEQVLLWDPEVIITWSVNGEEPGFLVNHIMNNTDWQSLQAVKSGRVYEAPTNVPFTFFGRLPAANQIIGLKWTGQLLYPEVYDYDIREEIREFYKLFYHLELTEEQLDEILNYADDRHQSS